MKMMTGLVMAGIIASTTISLQAAPLEGTFSISGAVTFSLTGLDWGSNGPTTGLFATSTPATGDFSGIATDLPSVYVGTAKDYTFPPGPVPSFLGNFVAPGFGGLFFDASGLDASEAPACSAVVNPGMDVACSFLGLTLKNSTNGLAINFAFDGFFQNGADLTSRSDGKGIYTAQIVDGSVVAFIQALNDNQTRGATYSADYSSTGRAGPNELPEPSSGLMLVAGAGLILAGARRKMKNGKATL